MQLAGKDRSKGSSREVSVNMERKVVRPLLEEMIEVEANHRGVAKNQKKLINSKYLIIQVLFLFAFIRHGLDLSR